MTNILVVGSANIDFTLNVARLPTPGETLTADHFRQTIGGKGVNQAVAAARAGGSVAMVTCVGDDPHGQILRRPPPRRRSARESTHALHHRLRPRT